MTNEHKMYQEREKGVRRGLFVGFNGLDDFYQFKQGYPLTIYGLPYSGKSEWWFEILINLSVIYGKQHFLFTPESGTPSEIYNLLIGKFIQKPVHKLYDKDKVNKYAMSDDEYEQGKEWVSKYFCIIDPDDFPNTEQITLDDVYHYANMEELDNAWSFDTITIDPWAELHLELEKTNGREDLYIGQMIAKMRKDGQEKKRTTCVINHVRDKKPLYDKGKAVSYHTMPMPTEITGGQMWFRKGFTMVCIYRPNAEIFEDSHENEVWVNVQKVKPRGSGKTGMYRMFYDAHKEGRYYELINADKSYAKGKQEDVMALARPNTEPDEESPF